MSAKLADLRQGPGLIGHAIRELVGLKEVPALYTPRGRISYGSLAGAQPRSAFELGFRMDQGCVREDLGQ